MQKIVISGGTGFIGRALVSALRARGDGVTVLTRDPDRGRASVPAGVQFARWDPNGGSPPPAVDGAGAVVHLAGEQAVGARWSERVKRDILDSRIRGTDEIVAAMGQAAHKP